ncbi:hypothetical protein GDO81_014364 [Engystomops pustulosus]|uniref:Uncharacterized protein n=1 Tax=Engystomops pustulosus TaxID=76066 RepID=A0AAV7B9U9_ENGPU|nr:hypothetical protein GDO81_014364 [Engystomops pustulosus]
MKLQSPPQQQENFCNNCAWGKDGQISLFSRVLLCSYHYRNYFSSVHFPLINLIYYFLKNIRKVWLPIFLVLCEVYCLNILYLDSSTGICPCCAIVWPSDLRSLSPPILPPLP